jgi:hypothetical protein
MSEPSSDQPGQPPPGPGGDDNKPEDQSETSSSAEETPATPPTDGEPQKGEVAPEATEDVPMEELKPVEDDLADVPESVRNVSLTLPRHPSLVCS